MPTNHGLLREKEMIAALDSKKVSELSNNMRHLLEELYGVLDENEIVKCLAPDDYYKPDFFIIYRGIKKGISMKSGRSNIVHSELVNNFIEYLRELNVSEKTLETILLYHFGDGTTDGSGSERFEFAKLHYLLDNRIKEANDELNSDIDRIYQVLERCVFAGAKEEFPRADALYHGDVSFGVVATEKQVRKHIYRKNWKWMDALHIGPLMLRPHARYIGVEIASEKRRHTIECHWSNLAADIAYISKRYDN